MNAAVEAGEESRRKLQRELESAMLRERAKEEERERVERQKERLREEIEDMTIALQRERQNCTALEKRQKKFDQVRAEWIDELISDRQSAMNYSPNHFNLLCYTFDFCSV